MAKVLEARLSQWQVDNLLVKGEPEAKIVMGIVARQAEADGAVRVAILFPRTASDFEVNAVMVLLELVGTVSTAGKLPAYEINRQ